MLYFTRKLAWFAAAAVVVALLAARPSVAQGIEADAKAAAQHEAEVAADAGHGEGGGPNPLAVDPDLAIWTLIVFAILFGLLSYFAWPQISAALEERERKIAETIAAAEARLDDAKRVLADHEAKLAAAAGEVRALLEEAQRDAEHTRKSIEEKGRQAAKAELDRGLLEIKRATDGAVETLARKSADVAIDLARKVIKDKLSADEQNQIVRDALGKLAATTPSKN